MDPTYDMWIKYGELYTAKPGECLGDLGHILTADVFSTRRINCTYKQPTPKQKIVIYYDRIHPATFDIFWNKIAFDRFLYSDPINYKNAMIEWLLKNLITGHMQSVNDIAGIQLKCIPRKRNFKKPTITFGESAGVMLPSGIDIGGCYNILGQSPDKRTAVQIYMETADKITVYIYELMEQDLLVITHIFGQTLLNLHQYFFKDYAWDVYEMIDDIRACDINELMQIQNSIFLTFLDKDGSHIPCLQNKQYF